MKKLAMGERIRQLRLEEKISLRELARRANISSSFLSQIENGSNYPTTPVLERIAGKLKVTVVDLQKLDSRSALSDLKRLLKSDPAWGEVIEALAAGSRNGDLTPSGVLEKLGKQK